MARYKLSNQKICGESEKVDLADVTKWIESKKDEIEKYHPIDIFNCDETRIFSDVCRVVQKGTKCHGKATAKNALRPEKLEWLIIGKSTTMLSQKGCEQVPFSFANWLPLPESI